MITAAGRPTLDLNFSTSPRPGRNRQHKSGAAACTSQRVLDVTVGYGE
jgi:hypothetical protein